MSGGRILFSTREFNQGSLTLKTSQEVAEGIWAKLVVDSFYIETDTFKVWPESISKLADAAEEGKLIVNVREPLDDSESFFYDYQIAIVPMNDVANGRYPYHVMVVEGNQGPWAPEIPKFQDSTRD